MEEVPGKRAGTSLFIYSGFAYHKDTTSAINDTYRCSTRSTTKCRGAVKIQYGEVVVLYPHCGHTANLLMSQECKMKTEIRRLCRESLRSFDDIFRTVSLRYPEAAVAVTLLSMRSTMERERSRTRPAIPANLIELEPILFEYLPAREIYRGMARGTDGSVGHVFAHRSMLDRLNTATALFLDCTFKVVPRKPKALQFLIIHIRRMDVSFPVLFVICSNKTTALYVAIWRFVLNLAPDMQANLAMVTCDFERAIINSVRQIFPAVQIHGCWFHLCQALQKQWVKFGLRRAPRDSLLMAMCIPLAPAARFVESLEIAAAFGDRITDDFPAVTRFFQYMRRQWIPLADIVSTANVSLRTNNVCETYHRHIVARMGGAHPNIWVFVEKVDQLIRMEELNWRRVETATPITRGRTAAQVQTDARIADLQNQLSTGRCTLEEFLRVLMEDRLHAPIAVDE